jgi:hypothetical protein
MAGCSRLALKAGMSALAVMLMAGLPAAAAEDTPAASAEAKADAPPQADYYTRRAKSILEAEKSSIEKPHPLAASYPGMDVVVCEAGCTTIGKPEVVYAKRHAEAAKTVTQGLLVPTSDNGGTAAAPGAVLSSNAAACVAGCYGGEGDAFEAYPESPVGEWSTSVQTTAPRDKLSPIR